MRKLLPLLALCCVLFVSCGFAGENYREYVTAILDCTYHAKSETYCNLTNASPESAEAIYQVEVQAVYQKLLEKYQIKENLISEETKQGYQQLAKDLLQKTKYQVRDVVYENHSYTINLVLTPVDFWERPEKEIQTYYYSEFFRKFRTAPTPADADKLEEEYAFQILQILLDAEANLDYLEPVAYTCVIQNNTVLAEDWQAIDKILLHLS